MAGSDDDFEALFDEISSQRTAEADVAVCNAVSAPVAVPTTLPPIAEAGNAPVADGVDAVSERDGDAEEDSDKPMFTRLGGIVRLLHDSLRELGYDRSLTTVATEINDAKDRLEYVASLTEQAANKVLNAIDIGMPSQDALSKQAKVMDARWTALFAGKLNVEEFKLLASDARQFATSVVDAADAEKARLLEIMMAQDFQDITGQLIKKIVAITNTAERELAQLLRDNAPPELKSTMPTTAAPKPAELLNGPAIQGKAMAQNGVDDLLESLGF